MTVTVERIQHRRGTAAAWTAANPVLLSAERGMETTTGLWKSGDGSTPWNALPYDNQSGGGPGGGPVNASDIADSGAVGRDVVRSADQPTALAAIGAAPVAHSHPASAITDATVTGRSLLTATDVSAVLELLGLDDTALFSRFQVFLDTHDYPKGFTVPSGGSLPGGPAVRDKDLAIMRTSGGVGGSHALTVLAQGTSGAPAASVGSGALSASGGTDDVWVYAWSANMATTAGSPTGPTNLAQPANAVSGGGRTWTRRTDTDYVSINGQIAGGWWRGVPNPTATTGAVTATFAAAGSGGTAAKDRCGLIVCTVSAVDSGEAQGDAVSSSATTVNASLTGVLAADPLLSAIITNTATDSTLTTPSTTAGWAADSGHTVRIAGSGSTPSVGVTIAFVDHGVSSVGWNVGASAAQKGVSILELTP